MSPSLKPGSVLISKSEKNYSIGDIVSFENNNKIITHRIYEISSETIITKGDANEDPDFDSVEKSQIIGKKLLSLPYLGYAIDFVKTPKGFVAFVIIPASIIIYEELKNLKDEIRKKLGRLGIVSFLLFGISGVSAFTYTNSHFSDFEKSNNSLIQAADSFSTPAPTILPIVINEFYAWSTDTDWVELYNPNDSDVDISNWVLDDKASTQMFQFDTNTQIPENGFIIAEVDDRLNRSGDTISLYNQDSILLDQKSYNNSEESISEGRYPDGQNWTDCMNPSPNAKNNNTCPTNTPTP